MEGGVVKEKGVRGKYLGKVDMKKTPTYHSGANAERTAILAKVRRMVKTQPTDGTDVYINGTELVKWLLQRNERYRKNPGGL